MAPQAAAATPADAPLQATPQARDLLPWLMDSAPAIDAPITAQERRALSALDQILAMPAVPDNLLPRAAALIPQLIALVRQTSLPIPAIAERVSKDAVLSAELMRLASSPYYRVQGEVTDLVQAINLIGLQGLQTVIARVVLKPIYRSSPGPLSALTAARLWEYCDALARHTAIGADAAGQSVFDAYLSGLLQGTGWTVACCAIDRAEISLATPLSIAFVQQMGEKAHRLFGHAAQRWEITPGFVALARDARQNGLATGSHSLVPSLQWAHQRAMDELAPP